MWGLFAVASVILLGGGCEAGMAYVENPVESLERPAMTLLPCPAGCGEEAVETCRIFGMGDVDMNTTQCTEKDGALQYLYCTCNGEKGVMLLASGERCEVHNIFPRHRPFNPDGAWCLPQTGLCPTDCSEETKRTFCWNQGATSVTCADGVLKCELCLGGTLKWNMQEADCSATWTPYDHPCANGPPTCSGHGCCTPSGCSCFDTPKKYVGENCSLECDGKVDCEEKRIRLTLLFGDTPSARPAVIPFLALSIVYICFSACRKRWSYERPPELDAATASAMQSASISTSTEAITWEFRDTSDPASSFFIPPRPSRSQGMWNRRKKPAVDSTVLQR